MNLQKIMKLVSLFLRVYLRVKMFSF